MATKNDPTRFDWNDVERVTCAHCKIPGIVVRDIVPYGIKEKVLLHDDCWRPWMEERDR